MSNRARCECLYCGHTWFEYVNQYNLDYWKRTTKCTKCKDPHIKFYLATDMDVFGYNDKKEPK